MKIHVYGLLLILIFGIYPIAFADKKEKEGRHKTTTLRPPGGMHPQSQIKFVKKQIREKKQPYSDGYAELIKYAERAKGHDTQALADFQVPGYYKDSTNHRKNSKALQSDSFDAYACALAYQLSGDKKYAAEAIRFLNAWAGLNKSYSDHDGSLVMAYSGTGMVIAAELLSDYKGWKNEDRQAFFVWVKEVYRKSTNEIRNRKNNWADWGRFGSILSASLLDDEAEIKENIRLIKSDLFDKIAADGHMPHETARGANGIWYTYFSLAPITAASWVAYNETGEDIFNYTQDNRSIKMALDYLHYFNTNSHEWKWFQKPNLGAPGKWPGNLLEAMSGIYNDHHFSNYVEAARPICYDNHHFAWTFPTLMKTQLKPFK
jgi:hypothetical protein